MHRSGAWEGALTVSHTGNWAIILVLKSEVGSVAWREGLCNVGSPAGTGAPT